jgi:hypothetical protein
MYKIVVFLTVLCMGMVYAISKPLYHIRKASYGMGEKGRNGYAIAPAYYDVTPQAQRALYLVEKNGIPIVHFPDNKIPASVLLLKDPVPGVPKQFITQYDNGKDSYIQIDFEHNNVIDPKLTVRVGPHKIDTAQQGSVKIIQAIWGARPLRALRRTGWQATGGYRDISEAVPHFIAKGGQLTIPESYVDFTTQQKVAVADPVHGLPKQILIAYELDNGERNLGICFEYGWNMGDCITNGNITTKLKPGALPGHKRAFD